MGENILVVDDEKEIADLLEVYLKSDGYTVHKFYNGTEALQCIEQTDLDLAVLDVMLPDIDGFRVCQKIRERFYFPVIMLTAKVEDGDKIMGLTIGADDYITKPFTIGEVIARVRAVLRRTHAPQQVVYNVSKTTYEPDITFKTMRINRNEKACYINGTEIPLSRKEFDLLLFFLTHRERIHSRDEIMSQVWGNVEVTNRAIDTNITRLRKKIAPYGENIVTRLGFGYGFKADLN